MTVLASIAVADGATAQGPLDEPSGDDSDIDEPPGNEPEAPTTTPMPTTATSTTTPPPTITTTPVAPTTVTTVPPATTIAPPTTRPPIPAPTTATTSTTIAATTTARTTTTTTSTTVPPTTLPIDESELDDATLGPEEPVDGTNFQASEYDGIYADGVPVGVAMATSRWLESRGDYNAQAPGSTASGAYQVIDSTWNRYAGYARAADAPPAVQDQFAYESFVAILKAYGNDVSTIPLVWYFPAVLRDPALFDTIPAPEAGNTFTIREYQTLWMEKFYELLGEGAPVFLPADTDPLIPAIAFPVLGPVSFIDDWHFSRAGGDRVHEGLDMIGSSGQPLRAAFDGRVERLVTTNNGISGVSIELRRNDDLRAIYRHVNNDTPGTTDNSAIDAFRIHPGITEGTAVRAGQIIGFMGDTGNAVGIPHLHFELRNPERTTGDRTPFAPYPAILEAQQREQCSVGIGPWSTEFETPAELAEQLATFDTLDAETLAAIDAAELVKFSPEQLLFLRLTEEQRLAIDAFEPPVPFVVEAQGRAMWTLAADGAITANGIGALVAPTQGDCSVLPDPATWYGTDAAGLALDLLPDGWWGDDVDFIAPSRSLSELTAIALELAAEDASFTSDVVDGESAAAVDLASAVADARDNDSTSDGGSTNGAPVAADPVAKSGTG